MVKTWDPRCSWPSNGCSLEEARGRTADRGTWKLHYIHVSAHEDPWTGARSKRSEEQPSVYISPLETEVSEPLRAFLEEGRLVAYGRRDSLDAPPRPIQPELWPALQKIDWTSSSAGETRIGGALFLAIR